MNIYVVCRRNILFHFKSTVQYSQYYTSFSHSCCRYVYVLSIISVFFLLHVEAVQLITEGKDQKIVQPTEGATYGKIWKKKAVAKVNFTIRSLSTKTQFGKTCYFYSYRPILWTDLRHLKKSNMSDVA